MSNSLECFIHSVDGIPPGPSDFTCSEIGKALAMLHRTKNPFEKPSQASYQCWVWCRGAQLLS